MCQQCYRVWRGHHHRSPQDASGPPCPCCRGPVHGAMVPPDPFVCRLLQDLSVQCTGCSHTCAMSALREHQAGCLPLLLVVRPRSPRSPITRPALARPPPGEPDHHRRPLLSAHLRQWPLRTCWLPVDEDRATNTGPTTNLAKKTHTQGSSTPTHQQPFAGFDGRPMAVRFLSGHQDGRLRVCLADSTVVCRQTQPHHPVSGVVVGPHTELPSVDGSSACMARTSLQRALPRARGR